MLSKIKLIVKRHQSDIIVFVAVILISLLSFAAGYVVAKHQEKTPIKFEKYENSNYWSRNIRSLSGLEAF